MANKSEWLFLDTRKIKTSNISSLYFSSMEATSLYEKCTTTLSIEKQTDNTYTILSESPLSPNTQKSLSLYEELLATVSIIVFWIVYLFCVMLIIFILILLFCQWYKLFMIFVILYIVSISMDHKRLNYILHNKFAYSLWDYFSFTYCYNKDTFEYIKNHYMKDNNRNLLILTVPHAVIPMSCRLSLALHKTIYGENFIPTQADIMYYLPVLRTISMWMGIQSVSKQSIIQWLSRKRIVEIVADGIAGCFSQRSALQRIDLKDENKDVEYISMKNHKGIAKLALQTQSDVIVAYGFGDTLMFNVLYDNMGIMEWMSRKLKAALFLFYGRYYIPFFLPFRQPLYYVLGPIVKNNNAKITQPNQSQIDEYHERLLHELKNLFDQHKGIYGWKHKQMVFV